MRLRKDGFTLVEILVAFAVFAVLAVGVFQVFSSANRANAQAEWYSGAQNEARNLFSVLRTDMAKASCPNTVTAGGSNWTACAITVVTGAPVADGTVISFPINEPDLSAVGGAGAASSQCTLVKAGRVLTYTRTAGAESALTLQVDDVDAMTIERSTVEVTGMNSGRSNVRIHLEINHSNPTLFPNARLEEETTARLNTDGNQVL